MRRFQILTTLILVAFAVSCAPAPATTPAASKTTPAEAPAKTTAAQAPSQAQPAGTLTLAVSSLGTQERWLPWVESGREGWLVMEGFYESLVDMDQDTGELVPMLADRWQVEEDGRRWRFFLRSDVPFQDGSGNVTAEDVKYSVEQFMTGQSAASNAAYFTSLVESVEAVSPTEVVFHLKQPSVTFIGRLTPGYFGVASKSYVESVGEEVATSKPVGTGPFKLASHQRNQMAALEAVENHWRQTPAFKTVVLRQVPDQAARLAMLRAGEVDVADMAYKFKREVEANNLKILRADSAAIYHVMLGGQVLPSRETFDPTVPWVGDPNDPASQERALKVRKALNLAVDKQAIIDSVFEGEGVPSVAPFYLPGSKFLPDGLEAYPYDPAEAKRLLTEAGYPQGFDREIEMHLMPWPGRAEMVDVGEATAGFWERNLGLKVKRTPIDYATWAPQVADPRKTAWRTFAQGYIPRPVSEPVIGMDTWLTSKASRSTVAEVAEIDEIHSRITSEPDANKRAELYGELAQVLYDGYYAVPIAAVPAVYAANPKTIGEWSLPPGESYITGYEYARPTR